jgi:hypothetical protein
MAGIHTLELPRMRFTVSEHPELISVELITEPHRPRRPRRDVLVIASLIGIGVLGVGGAVALAILGL